MSEARIRGERDNLLLMAAVFASALPAAMHLPLWASALFTLLFLWRLGLALSGKALPMALLRWVLAAACALAVWSQYRTLLGREPGVTLLVLFLGLKLLEMRARRDSFIVILLCFFLLITHYFHAQTLTVGALTLAATTLLVAAMGSLHRGLADPPMARRLIGAAALLAQALPIAALLFVLFPRVQGPLWGSPDQGFGARTGLSDSMQTGAIAQLASSDEIAFRVRFQGDPPARARLYWRGPVFGSFDGATWRSLRSLLVAMPPAAILPREGARIIDYEITLEPHQRDWLFALEAPVGAGETIFGPPVLRPDLQLVARERIVDRIRYRLRSQLDYRAGLNETRLSRQNWLGLPPGFNPRTLALAAQWRETENDDGRLVDKALALFASAPFRYTMSPPALGRNSVDDFLFETRAGFCEHYASAFVVLMRALDIPARVVTGYQGGELNPVDGFWLVRQADAHAWAEVWLEARGWVRVDPTSAIAPQRIERGSRAMDPARELAGPAMIGRLRFNLDAIANAWNQWVLSYDRQAQRRMLSSLGLGGDDWRMLILMLGAGLAVAGAGLGLMTLRQRGPRDPLANLWRGFCRRLEKLGIRRESHETALQLLVRAEPKLDARRAEEARRIVALYNQLRFGTGTPDRASVADLRRSIRAFRP